jgi:triosephosphate isomerase
VGETIEQRDQGNAHKAVLTQLKEIVPVGEILIAYEPLWSIGTGQTPTVEDIALMYQAIHDDEQFAQTPILYGGSVTPDNIAHILSIPGGRGVLVGGACLDVTKMNQMAKAL